jgi:acyl-CoA dehydrogenase
MAETSTDLFDLTMSDQVQPLFHKVKQHVADNVDPVTEEFFALDKEKEDRWSFHPRQLEILDEIKQKAREAGLWNFFLPDADTGEGLSNLDYAYIAAELGKSPLSSESMNCSAPDTGNMEVLERVGTEAQKKQRRDSLGLRHDRAQRGLVRRQEHLDLGGSRRRRVGDQRREVLHLRRR